MDEVQKARKRVKPTSTAQSGVFAPTQGVGRYLTLRAAPGAEVKGALIALVVLEDAGVRSLGLGHSLVSGLGINVEGFGAYKGHSGPGANMPATNADLWIFLGGSEMGSVNDRVEAHLGALGEAFNVIEDIPGFNYRNGRDLTG